MRIRQIAIMTGSALAPGVIAAIQTLGDRINLHPHLHFLATECGVDAAGVFHQIARLDDSRLAEVFAREVLAMLVRKELLNLEWAERILSWRHTGFNVHRPVRTKTKLEPERVEEYMIRPLLRRLLRRLTASPGRRYIIDMIMGQDSAPRTGIQLARKQQILIFSNSYTS